MSKVVLLALVLFTGSAMAVQTFRCTAKYNGKSYWFEARVSEDGRPLKWSGDALLRATKDSFFSNFSHPEDNGVEYSNTAKARNGFALWTVGTTADEMTVGINATNAKAFFSYRDHGSGAGHFKLPVTCKRR